MSLMYFSDKYVLYLQPHLDFGLNLLGGDVMAIPGVYQYVQVLCLLGFKSAICFNVLYDDLLYYGLMSCLLTAQSITNDTVILVR